jgi:hypothetical protein
MVRPQVYRLKKYDAKVVGDVVKARVDALKPIMTEQQTQRFSDLQNVENTVKSIVEEAGIFTPLIPSYLNFARELYSLSRRFSGATLNNMATIVFNKWKTIGLEVDLLKTIGQTFGIDVSGWS